MHRHAWGELGLRDPGFECDRTQRPADQVTLRGVALPALQQAQAMVVFDPLGDHLQTEVVAHLDGRAHDHGVFTGFIQIAHEGLIDLQFLHR